MTLVERLVLIEVSQGNNTMKSLEFLMDMDEPKIKILLGKLIEKKMITVDENAKIHLTITGLLESTKGYLNKGYQIDYDARDVPFFTYRCNHNKDAIIVPYLSFDTTDNKIRDMEYKIYETKLEFHNFNIGILEVIENLFHDSSFETSGSLWIMEVKNNKFCGHGIKNLFLAKSKLNGEQIYFKMVYSEQAYIFQIQGKITHNNVNNMNIKVYLTNTAETPYLDVLTYLNRKLKPFLYFVNLKKLPLGREIIIKGTGLKTGFMKKSSKKPFLPIIKAKSYFKGENKEINSPLIIVIDPINTDVFDLKDISPWFVTCNGGFLNEDFKMKRMFKIWAIESYELPDLLVCSVNLHPYTPPNLPNFRKTHIRINS